MGSDNLWSPEFAASFSFSFFFFVIVHMCMAS
jgi:hypothetical protein